MGLLDPSPDEGSLTTSSIAKAYDCLLSALCSLTRTSETKTCTIACREKFNWWMNIRSDLYRALLLSAYLMLGMAQRESTTNATCDDERHDTSREIVLNLQDVGILKQTQRRCKLLLLELSEVMRLRCESQGIEKRTGDDEDWHDSILPRSKFQLLRECFELTDAADGTQERLVSLDLLGDVEICDLSEIVNENEEGNINVNDDDIGKKESGRTHANIKSNTCNEEDIASIGFDRQLLEMEESELIDIAMPETIVAQDGGLSPKKGKKRKRKRNEKPQAVAKNRSHARRTNISKQGYLVQVNSGNASSARCFVKLTGSGLISINSTADKVEDATLYYILAACRCEPRPIGDTFNFSVSCVKQIRGNTDEELKELLFKVDEGLTEGFAWVKAISEVALVTSSSCQRQDQIRREWSDGGWKECAQYRAIEAWT